MAHNITGNTSATVTSQGSAPHPGGLTGRAGFKVMQLMAQLAHQRADLDGLRIVARFQRYHGYATPCVLFDEMAGQVASMVRQ